MRKRALGKGIEALIPVKEEESLQQGYRMIPIADISPNPYQPRAGIDEADIKELAASIKEKGIIEPVIVKKAGKKYILAAGERRLRAARVAGLKEIPAVIRDLTDQDLLEIGLIENLHRKDLNPVEEAIAYDELNKKFGMTHERIAQLVGKDRSTITNTLRILGLPEKVKRYLKEGKLTSGHARALLGVQDEIRLLQLADRIVKEELSVRAAEILIKRVQKRPTIIPGPQKEPNLLILEDELSKLLHTKVTIEWKRNKGTITIYYYSLEDFTRIHEILKKGKKS
ncbi:MAG TPA: ParB/RepB/Spo0J family partition protein [candidate division WOR-3 bacterium]|uniref:ParB/RepB/Spo0J family partition protein n=1 Tax=candidate division WOR-3 bacterium TaxID=2052148 RepID=A0A9C9EKL1_UNCW3|nr:ParB/RepB/Spo0J family partition protein [candidate division WOR-3 bacterium]